MGRMVRRAVDHSDPTDYALQAMPDGTTIKYFEVPETINTRLQHHRGHDVLEYVNPQVWAEYPSQVGKTNVTPIKVMIKDHAKLPSIRQYPLKSQAAPSIDKLIQELLKQGILVPCQSECNTPILAVPKPAKPDQYRLVQDLRSINAIAQPLHALVPNPAHILAQIPAQARVFAVIDLQHAFFALPLATESQYLFAFTYNGQQYTWTRLPQGFVNSPTLFSRCLQTQLQALTLEHGSTLVQYVDDILVASPDEPSNRDDVIQLLNHLSSLGYVVSQAKVLVAQRKVKFLGVLLTATERSLDPSRIEPICQFPAPTIAKEVRHWLGMVNYCRQWIPNIAVYTKLLTPYTSKEGNFTLTTEAVEAFRCLKQALLQAPALGRPLYDRPFQIYCTVLEGCSTAVLTQKHGDKHRPVAYYSSKLDPVALGHPVCTQILAAIYNSLQAAANITLQQDIMVYSSHSVIALLGQLQTQHLTAARQNRYEIYLLNNPRLTFKYCTTINPACFLSGPPVHEDAPGHDCLALIQETTTIRDDLSDIPLEQPDMIMYVDGSALVSPTGRRLSGYAIIDQDGLILEAAAFQTPYSAQQAELFALTRACILGGDRRVNIYTDSRYAFGVVHDFGQLWKNRGFLTSAGTEISNRGLVNDLLQALLLPAQISVIKCAAHTNGTTPVDVGNERADRAARTAAQIQQVMVPKMLSQTKRPTMNVSASDKPMPTIQDVIRLQEDAPESDKQMWKRLGCTYDSVSSLWTTPAHQTCMSDVLALWVIECVHFATHCGARGTSDLLLDTWWHPKMQGLAQSISNRCLICQQYNTGKGIPCGKGQTPLPSGPFETLQMDYIELERCQCYKYVLVIVDVFSRWS
ncbi:uncharacterized protein [Scyliorhinus torazame]|uniref:uncharacterized protein n=1 Tax=Scyliorhinus torazame TaxID=75743 RepID=UPI003B5AA841